MSSQSQALLHSNNEDSLEGLGHLYSVWSEKRRPKSVTVWLRKQPSNIVDCSQRSFRSIKRFLGLHILSRSFYVSLLPCFMRPGGLQSLKHPQSSTAYLDAVRGFAALIVIICHFDALDNLYPLPDLFVFRFLKHGRLMVDIFFIISGYVLTRKMLSLMRRRDSDSELLQCFASSTFRRYLRLYLSACSATFISMTLFHFGAIAPLWWLPMEPRRNYFAQILDWTMDTLQFANPFAPVSGHVMGSGDVDSRYHAFLWTIPTEFRGSLIAFLFCIACCRLTPSRRIMVCWLLIILCYLWCAVYAALFLFGVFLAELSLKREQTSSLHLVPPSADTVLYPGRHFVLSNTKAFVLKRILALLAVIIGLIVGTQPDDLGLNGPWPWPFLCRFIPHWWPNNWPARQQFWVGIGAALIMTAIDSDKIYQRPFTWSLSRYIGRLSFGIYLMQSICFRGFWWIKLRHFATDQFGINAWVAIAGYIMFMFQLLCLADYFTRLDDRVIQSTKWLEQRVFLKQ